MDTLVDSDGSIVFRAVGSTARELPTQSSEGFFG